MPRGPPIIRATVQRIEVTHPVLGEYGDLPVHGD